MPHLTRTLALIAIVVAAVLGADGFVALAQSTQSTQRSAGGVRAPNAPTPPPLPFGDQSRGSQGASRSTDSVNGGDASRQLSRYALPGAPNSPLMRYTGPRPPIPKLTDLLKHRGRRILSASGASITLTGTSVTAYLDDQTLSYGATVYWLCQNLKANTTYRYIVFSPDGYAWTVSARNYPGGGGSYLAAFTTDGSGRCEVANGGNLDPYYANLTLQTPLTSSPSPVTAIGPGRVGATDPPYSGVWAIAVQNTGTNQYEAVAYAVVLGTLNFASFSNAGFTTKANDFASGSTVYVAAAGLNPAHFYSFGFVNTAGNNLPCVFTIPSGAQNNNNNTCFLQGATGVLPTAGAYSGQWTTPAAGANSVGTYSVQLFDASTNDLISTQQISLNPASVVWGALIPYNGATNGTNLADTFATDGILNANGTPVAEQSVTGLTYSATGLTAGHSYQMTVSNANGVVMSGTTTDPNGIFGPQAYSPPAAVAIAGTTLPATKIPFPINLPIALTAFGQTQIPFAPNVYTAQLYDVTAGAVAGSKSFSIVSYAGTFQWTNPAGAYVNANAGGVATNVTTTLRNTAGVLYGNWNGDGIKAITITQDAGAKVTLGAQVGVTTTTDSSGQTWNIVATAATVTLTPAVAGQSLPVNGTLPVPFTVATTTCPTACVLRTSITPLHGVLGSATNATMTNAATNGLDVFNFGVLASNTVPTYRWLVGAYSNAGQLPTPRYNQMMYRSGTNGANGGTYTLTLTVTNNGAPQALANIELVMPSTVDPNHTTPALVSATINGANKTGNWFIATESGANGSTADTRLGNNAFALVTTTNAATLAVGKTATFVITLPILQTAFPFQEVLGTADYYNSAGAGGAQYNVGPDNVLSNAVAGTTNVDSTELAVFSLDPTLMSTTITPAVVPALAGSTATFKFINTSTGLDPNPDYVNQLTFTVPTGAVPSSVTVASPNQSGVTWFANPTGTAGQWRVELCQPGPAPCPGNTDANALPPGAELDITFNYAAAPTIGTYPIAWNVRGANGNAVVTATAGQQPSLVIANTTAQTSFTFVGGYTAAPSYPPGAPIQPVTSGSQPVVGSWSNFTNGNAYVFELHNNGSTAITDINIAIPSSNTSGQVFDAQAWQVIASSIYVYGQGAQGATCLANGYASLTQPVRGSPGTPGNIILSGCNLPVGKNLDVFFYALSPYDIGSTFKFPASVANGSAAPNPVTNANTLPIYSLSNTVRVVIDARLAIEIPTGSPGSYAPALFGGSTPAVNCPGCTFTTAGTYPLINLNNIVGTVTAVDSLAASVYSDSANGWNLSVSADVNPGTSSGQLSTWVTASSSAPGVGTYTRSVTSATLVPTAGTLTLSTFTGAVRKQPIDNIMSYTVNVNPLAVNNNTTTTVTLTYTLIAN
jgi:hypothetical protein